MNTHIGSDARTFIETQLGIDEGKHRLTAHRGKWSSADDAISMVAELDADDSELLEIADDDRLTFSIRIAAKLLWFTTKHRTTEEQAAHIEIVDQGIWTTLKDHSDFFRGVLSGLNGDVGLVLAKRTGGDNMLRNIWAPAIAGKEFTVDGNTELSIGLIANLGRVGAKPVGGWMAHAGMLPANIRVAAIVAGLAAGETLDEATARRYLRRISGLHFRKALNAKWISERALNNLCAQPSLITPEAAKALFGSHSPYGRFFAAIGGADVPASVLTDDIQNLFAGYEPGKDGSAISQLIWRVAGNVDSATVAELATHPMTRWMGPYGLDVVELGKHLAVALANTIRDHGVIDRWVASGLNTLDRDRIVEIYETADRSREVLVDWAVASAVREDDAAFLLDLRPSTAVVLVKRFEDIVREAAKNGLLERL